MGTEPPRRNWYHQLWYEAFAGPVEDQFAARMYLIFAHAAVLLGLDILLILATLP